MKKIREIIRLNFENGIVSHRKISRALNVSRPVVAQYLSDFKASGLKYQDIVISSFEGILRVTPLCPFPSPGFFPFFLLSGLTKDGLAPEGQDGDSGFNPMFYHAKITY